MKPPTPEQMDEHQLRRNIAAETERQLLHLAGGVLVVVILAALWWWR